jgi:hypothetical protein
MPGGPLDDTRLRSVEVCLNEARFDDAQKQLAELGARQQGAGVAYLTARLLFQRGRLDRAALAQRLQDILLESPGFPEARGLLEALNAAGEANPLPIMPVPSRAPELSRAGAGKAVAVTGAPPLAQPVISSLPIVGRGPVIREKVPLPSSTPPEPSASRSGARRLETPRVPDPAAYAAAARLQAAAVIAQPLPQLEPPRSELPTEPAPPPSERGENVALELADLPPSSRRSAEPIEAQLLAGRPEAALASLEKLAASRLDALLVREVPRLDDVADQAAEFLTTAAVTSHFGPYDLSLESLERLDAALALFTQRPIDTPRYALSVLLTAYVGECVRVAGGGRWQGRLAEPDSAKVERRSGQAYVPWQLVQLALTRGGSLRADAGPRPHPAAEPCEPRPRPSLVPPAPWDPEPWPALASLPELGRNLPASVIGSWTARVLHVPLDRSLSSAKAIERYVSLLAPHRLDPPLAATFARRPAVLAGAYLGELLCLHAAGRWAENDLAPSGPLRFEVVMPDGSAAYPVLWTHERLRGTERGSLEERLFAALGR